VARPRGVRVTSAAPPTPGTPPAAAAAALHPVVERATAAGADAAVETHVGHMTEMPAGTVDLVEAVPGLGVTLDPSHFYAGPAAGENIESVYTYVRHVHVRDAGAGAESWQLPFGTGEIDFQRILSDLRSVGFGGPVSIEYIETEVDVVDDVLRAKSFLEERSLVA
jgi:sugar phosphate isomerase/epimerase